MIKIYCQVFVSPIVSSQKLVHKFDKCRTYYLRQSSWVFFALCRQNHV